MQTTRNRPHSLNYFQQSPVRGQLEPADRYTGDGRFLQCTDTPNELKVLLPAKTSTLYGNLLAAEVEELGKGQTTSWDRIKEIRRLKERMIHKCERLARASVTDRNATPMITLYAPPEFRLREMEKWLKQQSVDHGLQNFSCCSMCGPLGPQDSRPTLSRKASGRSTSVIATRTAITTQGSTTTWIAPSYPSTRTVAAPVSNHTVSARATRSNRVPERVPKLPGGSSSQTYIEPDPAVVHSQPKKPEPNHQPSRTAQRSNSLRSREGLHVPNATRQPGSPPTKRPLESTEQPRHAPPSREAVTEAHALPNKSLKEPIEQQRRSPKHEPILLEVHPRALMKSPDPLPIPHRPRGHQEDVARNTNESAVADHSAPASEVASEQEPLIIPDPASRRVEPPEETPEEEPTPFPSTGQILETIHEKPEESEVCAARPLIRRRSSLKNKTSMSKLSVGSQSKSVTWAMDRAWTQQMAEIVKNTNEAEVIAYDVGEVRLQYHEEMAKMRITCHDVLSTVQALGADTELCQREGVALVQQENKILALSDEIKRMEASYKEKVVAVLEETKRLVELCDKTRDLDD